MWCLLIQEVSTFIFWFLTSGNLFSDKELEKMARHENLDSHLPGGSAGKYLPANARDAGLIPGLERSPGGGNGNPSQYSWVENPTDRGAWQATVRGLQTGSLSTHSQNMHRSCRAQRDSLLKRILWWVKQNPATWDGPGLLSVGSLTSSTRHSILSSSGTSTHCSPFLLHVLLFSTSGWLRRSLLEARTVPLYVLFNKCVSWVTLDLMGSFLGKKNTKFGIKFFAMSKEIIPN